MTNETDDLDPGDVTQAEAEKIQARILTGQFDGYLVGIVEAAAARMRQSQTRKCWRITYNGDTWDEDTVTVAELQFVEQLLSKTGKPFSYLGLNPMAHANHLGALVVAHEHHVKGVKVEDAINGFGQLTQRQLADIIAVYEVPAAPKDQEPSESS